MSQGDPSALPTGAQGPAEHGETFHLLDYWRLLVQRRRAVFVCLAATVAAAAIFTLLATPLYQASTTLQISRQGPEITTFKDVLGVDPAGYLDFYQTQFKIIQSRTVLRLAAEHLDLINRPEFATRTGSPIGRLLKALRTQRSAPEDPLDPAIDFLEDGLSVQPIRNSQLVRISFIDRDPQLATLVANEIAYAYQQFNIEARYNTNAQASEFLTKEVARVQVEITEAEKKLQAYSTRNEILSLGGLKDVSEQALADLNARLTESRGRLAMAEARNRSIQSAAPDALPEVLNSPLISRLKEEYASLEREHSKMAERFKPDWPAMRQVQDALDQAAERLRLETEAIAGQVRSVARADHQRARAEVDSLQEQVDAQKSEVQRVNRESIEYASLKAEIETKRKVLTDLVTRQSETRTSERLKDAQASNIRVVDVAETPKKPVSPRKAVNLLLAVLFGLGAGVGLAFLLDHVDNTVKNEQDVQRLSGLAVLGHVPLYQPLRAVGAEAPDPDALDPVDAASQLDPKSLFTEAFKNLRTAFLLASPERAPRTVIVTSFEPGDGKSTVCLNLAIVLTQMGRSVLVVDADLRKPRLHRMLKLDAEVGLSNILSGNASVEDAVIETSIPGVFAIASGPIPPNPSELLGSAALQSFLDHVTRDGGYDHVLIDSPPSLQVTDGVILASQVDATIVVVRGGKTSRTSLTQGVARVRQARGHVIGVVLNAVSPEHGSYYYYGKYGYYRAYGEEADTAKAPSPRRLLARRRRARKA